MLRSIPVKNALFFYCKVPLSTAMKRIEKRKKSKDSVSKKKRVESHQEFFESIDKEVMPFLILNGNQNEKKVFAELIKKLPLIS